MKIYLFIIKLMHQKNDDNFLHNKQNHASATYNTYIITKAYITQWCALPTADGEAYSTGWIPPNSGWR